MSTLYIDNKTPSRLTFRVRLENGEHVLEIVDQVSGVGLAAGARAELDLPENGSPTLLTIISDVDSIVFGNNNED